MMHDQTQALTAYTLGFQSRRLHKAAVALSLQQYIKIRGTRVTQHKEIDFYRCQSIFLHYN